MTPDQMLAEALMGDSPDVPTFLAELVERPTWMADAECRAHPEVEFFTVPGQSVDAAKAVCETCVVRSECLAYAIETDERTVCGEAWPPEPDGRSDGHQRPPERRNTRCFPCSPRSERLTVREETLWRAT